MTATWRDFTEAEAVAASGELGLDASEECPFDPPTAWDVRLSEGCVDRPVGLIRRFWRWLW